MKPNRNRIVSVIYTLALCSGIINTCYGMGLRSLVALPIEKGGAVIRLQFEHVKEMDTQHFTTGVAYGFSATHTLLLGLPYRLAPSAKNHLGDLSILYRHIILQQDKSSGTNRLGLLGGAIVPTSNDRDAAIQAGMVFTHFKNRHEIDFDILYQPGIQSRVDSGRYDISLQYRLSPVERPDWGLVNEVNSVLELNGRWHKGNNMTHQITAGLQWISQQLVVEAGIIRDINNDREIHYLLSTRFHF